jgi:hypothetical protein
MLEELVQQIRAISDNDIIIYVNGEKHGLFDEEYRKKVLNLASKFSAIYPSFFIETRGLAKMWNSIIISSPTEHVVLLNDDIKILNNNFNSVIESVINSQNFSGICLINGSFSHFIVGKTFIDNIGYFDERLLGFGEEDGDISYRCEKRGIKIGNLLLNGVINITSQVRHDHIQPGIGKYSKFNRDWIFTNKYISDPQANIEGMFGKPHRQILEDQSFYPFESFFINNKHKL